MRMPEETDRQAVKAEAEFRRAQREAREKRVVRYAEDGMCPAEIAKLTGIHHSTVSVMLRRAGVRYRRSSEDGMLALLPMGLP